MRKLSIASCTFLLLACTEKQLSPLVLQSIDPDHATEQEHLVVTILGENLSAEIVVDYGDVTGTSVDPTVEAYIGLKKLENAPLVGCGPNIRVLGAPLNA